MKSPPYLADGEEDTRFYALANCMGLYHQTAGKVLADMTVYFSPSPNWTRFSYRAFDNDGRQLLYHAGPQSSSADGMLIDAWSSFDIPPYAWSLVPRPSDALFAAPEERQGYLAARAEFCRAIYGPRVRAWTFREMNAQPLFSPSDSGYVPVDPFKATPENEEIMRTAANLSTGEDR